jgi:hypothetical protein
MSTHKAFRCKNCGHLEGADNAGEQPHPTACRVCGSGITLLPTVVALAAELAKPDCTPERRKAIAAELLLASRQPGARTIHPENWEILADATPERLAELGLKPEHAVRHAAWPKGAAPGREPGHFVANANESVTNTNVADATKG